MSVLYDREGNRKYLTVSERTAFLRVAQKLAPEVRTFCLVLAYTGARLSEVLELTPMRIDIEARLVILESLKKRRRAIFRAVPIPLELLTELDRVHGIKFARQQPDLAERRIWGWCRTTAWARVKECLRAADVAGSQAVPKGLRHAFAVGALQAGVPINFVRKWLGHSRLSTTEIYADAVGEEEQAIAARFWKSF
ncbi:MAG TPA: site-specific integrase [Blastocatellia bacterium]|nr:site-specific integrase [Blastocatellia bacterium]